MIFKFNFRSKLSKFFVGAQDLNSKVKNVPDLKTFVIPLNLTVCVTTSLLVGNYSLYYLSTRFFNHEWNFEVIDKVIWISALGIGFLTMLSSWRRTRILDRDFFLSFFLLVPSLLIICVSIVAAIPFTKDTAGYFWMGFGTKVFVLLVISIPGVYFLPKITIQFFLKNFIIFLLTLLFLYNYFPVLLQPYWAIEDTFHSAFVLNDVLAQSYDQYPGVNFAPQYTSVYGFVFRLALAPFSIDDNLARVQAAAFFLSFLSCITFILMIILGTKIVPQKLKPFAAFLIIPLTLVSADRGGSTTIAGLFSAVPIRTLSVFLIGLMILRERLTCRWITLLGFVGSLAAINNLDFGVATLFALIISLQFDSKFREQRVAMNFYLLLGVATGLVMFVGISIVSYGQFKIEYLLLFVKAYSTGLGSVPMKYVGPHILLLAIFIGSIAIGSSKLSNDFSQLSGNEKRAARTSLFLGLTAVGSFPYFVNRSIGAGQLQIFLLLAAPLILCTFSLINLDFDFKINRKLATFVFITLVPQALLIGALMQIPDGRSEWKRVLDISNDPFARSFQRIKTAHDSSEDILGEEINLAAVSHGNLYLGGTGMRNISIVASTREVRDISGPIRKQFCDYMQEYVLKDRQKILIEDFLDENGNDPLCAGFSVELELGGQFFIVTLK